MRVEFTKMDTAYNKFLAGKVKEFAMLGKIDDNDFSVYLDIILLALHPDSPMYSSFKRKPSWQVVHEASTHKKVELMKGFENNRFFLDAVKLFYEVVKADDRLNYILLIDKEVSMIEQILIEQAEERERIKREIAEYQQSNINEDDGVPASDRYDEEDMEDEEMEDMEIVKKDLPELPSAINYVRDRVSCMKMMVELLKMRDEFEERAAIRKTKKGKEMQQEVAQVTL